MLKCANKRESPLQQIKSGDSSTQSLESIPAHVYNSLSAGFLAFCPLTLLDAVQQMLLHPPINALEIFQMVGWIFQLLVKASCDFQPSVVLWSHQTSYSMKSSILQTVNW